MRVNSDVLCVSLYAITYTTHVTLQSSIPICPLCCSQCISIMHLCFHLAGLCFTGTRLTERLSAICCVAWWCLSVWSRYEMQHVLFQKYVRNAFVRTAFAIFIWEAFAQVWQNGVYTKPCPLDLQHWFRCHLHFQLIPGWRNAFSAQCSCASQKC